MGELEDKVKDLEQKVANLFMNNVALKTKLEASREVERQQQEEITSLKQRLVQALRTQVNMPCGNACIVWISPKPISLRTTGHCYSKAVTVKDQGVTTGGQD